MSALAIAGLCKAFGGLHVTNEVNLNVEPGERRLIIGPNGAGKTTLFNLITGEIMPDKGSIHLFGQDITAVPSRRRPHLGMARTYQIITLFPRDSIIHNVALALLGLSPARWNPLTDIKHQGHLIENARAALQRVGLAHIAERPLAQTSYGERRRVEIAMALAQNPKVLLLDEPFAGLSIDERGDVKQLLLAIPRDVTIVMIEHNMDVALEFAERITLLHFGEVIVEGTRAEVVADPRTREVYLVRHLARFSLKARIDAYYGDSHVLTDVSFELGEARMLGLLGRNGAGKSTCMHVTMGLLPPRRGEVVVFGDKVTGLSPEMVAARGVALVPQGRRIFKSLTVRENLMVAARKPDAGSKHAPWTAETVFAMFPRLYERHKQIAAHLSGGEQQMLAIGRALMGNPRVLLMDEPSEGLAPQIVAEVMATIRKLKESGLSIVLVEQNPRLVFDVADDIVILNTGHVVVVSTPAQLDKDGVDLRQHLGVFCHDLHERKFANGDLEQIREHRGAPTRQAGARGATEERHH